MNWLKCIFVLQLIMTADVFYFQVVEGVKPIVIPICSVEKPVETPPKIAPLKPFELDKRTDGSVIVSLNNVVTG